MTAAKTAFGLLPFVTFPVTRDTWETMHWRRDDSVRWREIIGGWDRGFGGGASALRTGMTACTRIFQFGDFGHDINRPTRGLREFYQQRRTERAAGWVGTVDIGLTYGVTENVQRHWASISVTRAVG